MIVIKRPKKTIFCYLDNDDDECGYKVFFDDGQLMSLERVGKMIESNGGKFFKSFARSCKLPK